jgi:hypothetical protein
MQRCPATVVRRPRSTRSPRPRLERRTPRAAQRAESRLARAVRCRPQQRATRGPEGTFGLRGSVGTRQGHRTRLLVERFRRLLRNAQHEVPQQPLGRDARCSYSTKVVTGGKRICQNLIDRAIVGQSAAAFIGLFGERVDADDRRCDRCRSAGSIFITCVKHGSSSRRLSVLNALDTDLVKQLCAPIDSRAA